MPVIVNHTHITPMIRQVVALMEEMIATCYWASKDKTSFNKDASNRTEAIYYLQ